MLNKVSDFDSDSDSDSVLQYIQKRLNILLLLPRIKLHLDFGENADLCRHSSNYLSNTSKKEIIL